MKRVGRNEDCPCGSGLKYKNCHGKKAGSKSIIIPVVAGLSILGLVALFVMDSGPSGGNIFGNKTYPQPAGDPPPGKIWSPEHGHWHDAPALQGQTGAAPQPPGEAPEGKVWSAEHGHWHDADGSETTQPVTQQSAPQIIQPAEQAAPGAGVPQPPGDPPPGKVWSSEHGHWHDVPAGPPYPQPPGDPPPGKVWSTEHGHWHDIPPGQ